MITKMERKRMEIEINALKENKEKMKREIEELKAEKNKKEQTTKKEQNKIDKTTRTIGSKERMREELFPPSPVPGPSGIARRTAKTRGPAEEYEEESEKEIKMGRWDYVGERELIRRREEEGKTRVEMEEGRRTRYDPQIGQTEQDSKI